MLSGVNTSSTNRVSASENTKIDIIPMERFLTAKRAYLPKIKATTSPPAVALSTINTAIIIQWNGGTKKIILNSNIDKTMSDLI